MIAYSTVQKTPMGEPDPEIMAQAQELKFAKVADTPFTRGDYYRIMRRGWEPMDQLFTSDKGGTYNASLFLRLADSFPEHFERGVGQLTDELFQYIVDNIEINPEHMASLTTDALVQPVPVVTLNDESPFYIIDGHHRIVRLYMEGYRQFYMLCGDRFVSHRCHVVRPTR